MDSSSYRQRPILPRQVPPFKIPRIYSEPDSPSIELGLGLAIGGRDDDKQDKNQQSGTPNCKLLFTESQLQELELQCIIYRYIRAGVRVPPSLLVPICRSLPINSAVPFVNIPTLHPLFPTTWCYKKGVRADDEPGRCKRTDGKKWRCTKEALPEQKYCESHIHRGRSRSRKPVEPADGTVCQSSSVSSSNVSK
ncbi:Growth-regulating factor 4 [Linum perenne]